jgi:betaine-homocysteine S-methyltransferase
MDKGTKQSRNILDRLAAGVVIGDGGYVFSLEKRGYVKAGPWTPEATVEHPEAGGLSIHSFIYSLIH